MHNLHSGYNFISVWSFGAAAMRKFLSVGLMKSKLSNV